MPTAERADRERAMRGQTAFDGKCTARRHSDGKPCQRPAARGAVVCPVHGGSAPQVKAAAKRRLDQAADVLVQRLLRFALDGETDDNTALRAIIAALDRAGIVVPNTVDVTVGTHPFEEVFSEISGGSREESRGARGFVDAADSALEAAGAYQPQLPLEIIDAEPVDSQDFKPEPYPRQRHMPPPITGDDAIAEAARINRELVVHDRKAVLPGRY